MQDDRQAHQNQAREDRQDFYEDEIDGHYRGGYYHDDDDWDDGEVAAVAIGAAAIGAVAGYAAGEASAPATTVVYTAPPAGYTSLPCAAMQTTVNGVIYYQCGPTWYTQAYGGSGVLYVPVPPPH